LAEYSAIFVERDIDFSVLPDLSDTDLQSLGLSLGHQRRLQRAIAERDKRSNEPSRRQAKRMRREKPNGAS